MVCNLNCYVNARLRSVNSVSHGLVWFGLSFFGNVCCLRWLGVLRQCGCGEFGIGLLFALDAVSGLLSFVCPPFMPLPVASPHRVHPSRLVLTYSSHPVQPCNSD